MTDRPSIGSLTNTPPADVLQVFLLGVPSVKWADHTLAISRRQVRALLYRLAASADPVPREQLCFLFWPDVPEIAARRKLSGLLAHLRRTLPDPDTLVAQDDHVGLDPDRTWSDVVAFEALCTGRPASAPVAALREAVELYRGPFLAGFSLPDGAEYEAWTTVERGSCERIYLEVLSLLIERGIASRDYAMSLAYVQRYLDADDLAEEMHRLAIELYTSAGDRSAALRQYEHCVTVLENELGVEPLPETQAAYQKALESKGARPPAASRQARLAPASGAGDERPPVPAWTTHPGLDVELVGREAVLQKLAEALARSRESKGSIFLISGEPGIGKSRLMQDFAAGLGDQALVLSGAGFRDTQASPYQPIVQALRPAIFAYHASLNVEEWCHTEVCRLMPELRVLHPDLPPAFLTSSEQAKATLFEALYQILRALAESQKPVLLCLDDLHWADGSTVDWLTYVGRQIAHAARPGVLILATYGSGDAGSVVELRRALAQQAVLSEVRLSGLSESQIQRLLRPLADNLAYDSALVSQLSLITGGNPFFLLETVRSLLEAGCQPEDLGSPEGPCLPDTILDAVEARVARLSPRARQVLEAGAVLGRSFSFGLVRRTSGRGELETVDGLDEVVARDLVQEGTTGYWFRHEIIRAAVYHQLSRRRKEVLHRRAGEALERLDPSNAAALARHFDQAGLPGRAAAYALEAGRMAKEVFAHVEARAYFDKVLELLEWEAVDLQEAGALAANERLRIEALFERGWALRLTGDMEAYARDVEEVARLAGALGDPKTLAHLRWRQAYSHRWFCRFGEARASAEEGVQLSRQALDPLLEALCRREVGLAVRATGDYRLARTELQEALAIFAKLGDIVYQVHTLGNLATLSWYEGAHEQAMSLSTQALALCEAKNLYLERRLPLGDMGAAAVAIDAVDLARQCLDESLTISRQAADRTQEILCLTHLGWLGVRSKRPAEALQHLQTGLALARRIGSCTEQSWLLSGIAEAYRLDGDLENARAKAQQALSLAQLMGTAYDQKLANWVLAKLEAS